MKTLVATVSQWTHQVHCPAPFLLPFFYHFHHLSPCSCDNFWDLSQTLGNSGRTESGSNISSFWRGLNQPVTNPLGIAIYVFGTFVSAACFISNVFFFFQAPDNVPSQVLLTLHHKCSFRLCLQTGGLSAYSPSMWRKDSARLFSVVPETPSNPNCSVALSVLPVCELYRESLPIGCNVCHSSLAVSSEDSPG